MLTHADIYVGMFSKLIPTVVETYKDTFPELEAKQQLIMEVVREEEESFEKMLVGGIKYFKDVSASMAAAKQTVVSGSKASKLSTSKASTLSTLRSAKFMTCVIEWFGAILPRRALCVSICTFVLVKQVN